MPRTLSVLLSLLCLVTTRATGQPSALTSSNLPIVIIDTQGQTILDEPKIQAWMGIIDNGPGSRNDIDDPQNEYEGPIGIEMRGSSSQDLYDKKSFAVETRSDDGENLNVSIFGMPKENDWILYGPYGDKSMLRNDLAMWMSRRMGHYASRTRFVELVLNGSYHGVYVFMEKIKRDKGRVDLKGLDPEDVSGPKLTGGYIIKIDKTTGAIIDGWHSSQPARAGASSQIYYQYHDPKPDEIVAEQKDYIQHAVRQFEDMMASDWYDHPEEGYPKYIDVGSFIDYFIVNEVSKNIDAYRLSTFMYKDRDTEDGRWFMGPVWDFNIAFGNADYYDGALPTGFQIDYNLPHDDFLPPFWWRKLAHDSLFVSTLTERWQSLRGTVLHTDTLMQYIDERVSWLDEAQQRNFERWPVLSSYVWPNPYIGQSYPAEVAYLKDWLHQRLDWIDANLPDGLALNSSVPGPYTPLFTCSNIQPNPVTTRASFTVSVQARQSVRVSMYDLLGREVETFWDGTLEARSPLTLTLQTGNHPSGAYFVRVEGRDFQETLPILLVR